MAEDITKSPTAAAPPATRLADQGHRQYIIAARRGGPPLGAGLRPMSTAAVRSAVGQLPGLEMVRVLRPRHGSNLSLMPDDAEVYVARIDPDRVEAIRQMTYPHLIIEEDAFLDYVTPIDVTAQEAARVSSWSSAGSLDTRQIRLRVLGEGDRPLSGVGVSVAGIGFPSEGRTDKRGEITLPVLLLPGKRPRSLYVSAPSNHWDQYLGEPDLSDGEVNIVRLQSIDETITGFPDRLRYGWGQLEIGLDRVPEALTCEGVRIAIVDSGVDTSHQLLHHIHRGLDLTDKAEAQGWTHDVVGSGSHSAGIIAARDDSGKMLRGFAPEAEVHVLKVFPGGRFSSLLEALDYCLEFDIDLVDLGCGSLQTSQAIEQKLAEAALHGIACIAAAGNSSGGLQYPASSPFTLAVGAIGRLNEYPERTWDATTLLPGMAAPDGIFAPSFSSFGPEVAVSAPGVAIVSTVPGGFQPRSGTSVAAAHVTGLAAMILAHHPMFQGPLRARTQQRVAALFATIRSLCVPYVFGSLRAVAGIPRINGLAQILRPSIQHGARPAGGNGGTYGATHETHAPGMPGTAFAGHISAAAPAAGAMFSPQEGVVMSGALADPLYVQAAALVAQAWPVQALLESLRRQYGGI